MSKPGLSSAHVTATYVLPPASVTVVAAPPDLVCQNNVEAVTGVPKSAYLDLLRRADCPVHVARHGKLRFVPRAEFVAWVRTLSPPVTDGPHREPPSGAGEASLEELAQEFDLKASPTRQTRRRR
jgi:hypothetical protein